MKLTDSVSNIPLVGPSYTARLKKLNIRSINDLLLHIPSRYADLSTFYQISSLKAGEKATVIGQITEIKNIYTKTRKILQLAKLSDGSGEIDVIWFNQNYLVNSLPPSTHISISGKVRNWNSKLAFISPEYEKIGIGTSNLHTGRIVPIYPETAGVSSKWLRTKINWILKNIDKSQLNDFLEKEVIKDIEIYELPKALEKIHLPDNLDQAEKARRRLAFNELLKLQLGNNFKKISWEKNKVALPIKASEKDLEYFIKSLPFNLTKSQKRAINEMFADFAKKTPMNRLLSGDVGSGKTVVAAAGIFASFLNGFQSILMAPTQILAQQHYETLSEIFKNLKIRTALFTSAISRKDMGKSDLFIGTHALLHRAESFSTVAFVVIDEQHRFGVEQRAHLTRKAGNQTVAPHVLTMTATPIPRTAALTFLGDLDLSTLDELPKGRKPVTTWIVPPQKRQAAYDWIKTQIKKGSQCFVVCPLIEESISDKLRDVKAAKAEYEKLKKIFPDLTIDLLHGRLKAKSKDTAIERFRRGKSQILVTTPVVEVGIDIPNATIMWIEAADRFGLAQLHQLRGRVGRGKKKSFCLLFSQSHSAQSRSRLSALTQTNSGQVLAELDLKMRGPGEIFGTAQSGFHELKIARWTDIDLIKKSKSLSDEIVRNPKKYRKTLSFFGYQRIAGN